MSTTAEQRIFISYRRSDCQSQANGLNDGLRHRLPEGRVFMDIDSIPIGADFEEHIRGEIEQCHVALILIGDNWLDARPGSDVRRIDEVNDFVRLEVESALSTKHLRVIPVLVEGATMPTPDELPESIQRLARLNAFEMSDQRWSSDIERLTQQLRQLSGAAAAPTPAVGAPTMTFSDVDDAAIRYAMSTLPSTFKTKDVSEHPAVLATHTEVSQLRNYHTIVGRYLMQHRGALGLDEPGKPVDQRGSIWTKTTQATAYARVPDRTAYPPRAAAAPPRPVASPASDDVGRSPKKMILWCVLTMGLAAFAAPVWAANRRPFDKSFRKRMHTVAGVLGLASLVGFALVGSSPEDAEGTPTGAASDVGVTMLMLVMAAGVAIILVYKKPQSALAGTESVVVRRDTRERYRQLVENDRPLARSMHVGRPDVSRDYDDGGLVDVNSAPSHALADHAGLNHAEAAKVVQMREELGRFVSMDELLVYVDLPESTAVRLRDVAVFV
jgi:DNA uptake protein ComE-like DNA-binding protein